MAERGGMGGRRREGWGRSGSSPRPCVGRTAWPVGPAGSPPPGTLRTAQTWTVALSSAPGSERQPPPHQWGTPPAGVLDSPLREAELQLQAGSGAHREP